MKLAYIIALGWTLMSLIMYITVMSYTIRGITYCIEPDRLNLFELAVSLGSLVVMIVFIVKNNKVLK